MRKECLHKNKIEAAIKKKKDLEEERIKRQKKLDEDYERRRQEFFAKQDAIENVPFTTHKSPCTG